MKVKIHINHARSRKVHVLVNKNVLVRPEETLRGFMGKT